MTALPFTLKRSQDVFCGDSVTSTTEKVHGLLRLDREALVIQWRVARTTEVLGSEIRSDEEVDEVKGVTVPLERVSGATVRGGWRWWITGPRIVLTASDLQAFEGVAGEQGLRLSHPAELVLTIRRKDRLAAEEFAAELALSLAEMALEEGSGRRSLPPGTEKETPE